MKSKILSLDSSNPPQARNRWMMTALVSGGLVMGITAWFSWAYEGGADAFHHYQVIRYSWDHPYLLLDLWGKPILTLLASPFARFGIFGVSVFSILCALLATWMAADIARRLGFRYSILGAVLILFAPEYFTSSIAPMTETLFSLFLVLAVYLFVRKRYTLSAIVISFVPLIRTEGYILFPLFAAAFLWEKRWIPVPFIATGGMIYSLIGWRIFGDFLWLIHLSPYSMKSNPTYGHGNLFYFVRALPEIAGYPMCLLLVAGLMYGLYLLCLHVRWTTDLRFKTIAFIIGCTTVYFAAHTYVWWRGMGASIGLTRVIAAIIPLMGIIALLGFQPIITLSSSHRLLCWTMVLGLGIWGIYQPFKHGRLPMAFHSDNQLKVAASVWLKNNGLDKAKIFYYDPFIFYLLGKDPYDEREGTRIWYAHVPPADYMMPGDILVWDAGLGYIEGHVRPDDLKKDHRLVPLAAFQGMKQCEFRPGIDEEVLVYVKATTD